MQHRYRDSLGAAASNIIAFRPAQTARAGLSLRDRMDVARWQEAASTRGYDRLVIHERAHFDPPDLDSFLAIYRRGDAWASWNVARNSAGVLAWCSRTGTDIGRFASVGDALDALLNDRKALT
jgi:hypothetical protein